MITYIAFSIIGGFCCGAATMMFAWNKTDGHKTIDPWLLLLLAAIAFSRLLFWA